jgi:hypothetical protein
MPAPSCPAATKLLRRVEALEDATGASQPRVVFLRRIPSGLMTAGAGVDQAEDEGDASFIDRARAYLRQKLGRPVYPMAPEYLHL